jgi:2-C-methyl-D-erythritol 4-phosphate cytidylyltransferase
VMIDPNLPTRAIGKTAVLIVSAGKSSRMNLRDEDPPSKNLFKVGGRYLIQWSLETFLAHAAVHLIVLIVPEELSGVFRSVTSEYGEKVQVIVGGSQRYLSVKNGLSFLAARNDWKMLDLIAIHDGARPCASEELIERCLRAASQAGAAVPGLPVSDTIKSVEEDTIIETMPREGLFMVQTPQIFEKSLLLKAYEAIPTGVTDDASLVERHSSVKIIKGDSYNVKLTAREDLPLIEWILSQNPGYTSPSRS